MHKIDVTSSAMHKLRRHRRRRTPAFDTASIYQSDPYNGHEAILSLAWQYPFKHNIHPGPDHYNPSIQSTPMTSEFLRAMHAVKPAIQSRIQRHISATQYAANDSASLMYRVGRATQRDRTRFAKVVVGGLWRES